MIRIIIEFSRYIFMLLFPAAVSVSFAGMERKRKNIIVFGCFIIFVLIFQFVNVLFWKDLKITTKLYPLLCHVPIAIFIAV